ncbi:MAG TPA: hypothetical protein VH331_05735 [Allosphingosinicella sp.]|jgi:hypothetical protein|nr:hypothetical protein [Allosphingosinicella sp.]
MILTIIFVYAAVVALAFVFQTKLIFPGTGPDPVLPHMAQQLTIEAPGGAVLKGVLIPASHPAPNAPLILSFPATRPTPPPPRSTSTTSIRRPT